ncbi:ATP-binding cassette domain-containing protein [Paractinoplanes durhamensis]|uniref:ATP-binding cassette domain-containing protein n=1 Tax=Paractinoplanes durhamensis TaxID=113563 RepID=UPI003631332B
MTSTAIRTEHLTKHYGSLVALDDLDLEVRPGEVFGFLGPNGAGKSTTIRLLLGQARPTAGRATIFGAEASDVARAHQFLAYVPADVSLWPFLTGAETLELLANLGPGWTRPTAPS